MFYEKPRFDDTSLAEPAVDPKSLGDVYRTSVRSADLTYHELGKMWAHEEAFDLYIDRVAAGTGVTLENPYRTGLAPREFIERGETGNADPFLWFEKRRHELAQQRPDKLYLIEPDKQISAFAHDLARKAETDEAEAWRGAERFGALRWAPYIAAEAVSGLTSPSNIISSAFGLAPVGLGAQAVALAAVKAGLINAGAEVAAQPIIQAWRKEAGLDYGVAQAALGVAGAFALGGVLDAGVRSAWRGARHVQGWVPTLDERGGVVGYRPARDAEEALAAAAKAVPDESHIVQRAYDGEIDALERLAKDTGADADPAVRGALQAARMLDEGPATRVPGIDAGEAEARMLQVARSVLDDDEPPPAVLASLARDGLDMSQDARFARAAEMGFDTGRVWYHGTSRGAQIDAFDLDRAGSATGGSVVDGVWLTSNRSQSDRYGRLADAALRRDDFSPQTLHRYRADVLEIYAPHEDRLLVYDVAAEAERLIQRGYGTTYSAVMGDMSSWLPSIVAEAKSSGKAGVLLKGVQDDPLTGWGDTTAADHLFVFDPSSVRSVNAAFDPAEAASPRLLASLPRERRLQIAEEAIARTDQTATHRALLGAGDMGSAPRHLDPRTLIDNPSGPEAKAQADALERDLAGAIEQATKPELAAARAEALAEIEATRLASLDERRQTTHLPGYGTPEYRASRVFETAEGQRIVGYEAAVRHLRAVAEAHAGTSGARAERRVTLLLGPPASGKSTIVKALARHHGAAVVSADDAKFIMPEMAELGAPGVHEESSTISKMVQEALADDGVNLVLEKLGDNPDGIARLVAAFRAMDYEVDVIAAGGVPRDELIRRARERETRTGRGVPTAVIDGALEGVPKTLERLRQDAQVRAVVEIDTSGDVPHIKGGREALDEPLRKALETPLRERPLVPGGRRSLPDGRPGGGREAVSGQEGRGRGKGSQEAGTGTREVDPKKSDPLAALAIAEGRYVHTPAAAERMAEIRGDIDAARKMLPADVDLRFVESLKFAGREANGAWDSYDRVVYVSLAGADPMRTLRHETVHALRQSGLMSDAEFDTLWRHAESTGLREGYGIDAAYGEVYRKAYGHLGADHVEKLLREETIADMVADRALNARRFGDGVVDRILETIVDFLKRVRDALHLRGFRDAHDIFEAIESGAMARRAELADDLAELQRMEAAGKVLASLGPRNVREAIDAAADAGKLTREEAARYRQRYDALFRDLRSASAAKDALVQELEAVQGDKRRRALLTEARRQILEPAILGHRNAKGEIDPVEGLQKVVENFGYAKFDDVVHRQKALLSEVHAEMQQVLDTFRKGAVTGDLRRRRRQLTARMDNIVRELAGEGTGDEAAKAVAETWSGVAEKLRLLFNEAGGSVRKLEGWMAPQHHDQSALLAAGPDAWVAFITPLLDRERMLHPVTGRVMSDEELDASLRYIWENVTEQGWLEREPSASGGGAGALYGRHVDHRFLHFKSADAWRSYQRQFGEADVFASMMGYVSTMTRDIAAMQILGPNPDAMFRYLQQVVDQRGTRKRPVDVIIREQKAKIDRLTARLGRETARTIYEMQDRVDKVVRELERVRGKTISGPTKKGRKTEAALLEEFHDLSARISSSLFGETPPTGPLAVLRQDIDALSAELRDPIAFPSRRNPAGYSRTGIDRAESMWLLYKGTTNTPNSITGANLMSAGRNFTSATALGSALLSSLSDFVTDGFARRMAGLPVMRTFTGLFEQFSRESRNEAVRAGLILDSALNVMMSQGRYVKSLQAVKWTGFIADRNIALQGLSAWTQARKHAFGMDFQGVWADNAGRAFADLAPVFRKTLERHGFDAADWERMRAARLYEPQPGATMLRPQEIAEAAGDTLARRYIAMILKETRRGTIEGTLKARSGGLSGVGKTQPGTIPGEFMRTASQFRSFAATFVMLQAEVIAHKFHQEGMLHAAGYASAFAFTSMIAGAAALQLKNLAAGRDVQDMDSAEFWMSALVQSGGLGIYGDFFTGSANRFGGGLPQTIMGPMTDKIDNLWKLTAGNVLEFASDPDKPTNLGREVARFVERNTPILSTNWYMKLAYNRILTDQLHYALDPEAYKAFQRRIRARERQFGNGFWWLPGESSPSRLPEVGR